MRFTFLNGGITVTEINPRFKSKTKNEATGCCRSAEDFR